MAYTDACTTEASSGRSSRANKPEGDRQDKIKCVSDEDRLPSATRAAFVTGNTLRSANSACPGETPRPCWPCHTWSSGPRDRQAPCRNCRNRGRDDSPDPVGVHVASRVRLVVEAQKRGVRRWSATGHSAEPGVQPQVERSDQLRSQEAGSTSVHTSDRAQGWMRLTLRKPCRTERLRPAAHRMIHRILARSRPFVA